MKITVKAVCKGAGAEVELVRAEMDGDTYALVGAAATTTVTLESDIESCVDIVRSQCE